MPAESMLFGSLASRGSVGKAVMRTGLVFNPARFDGADSESDASAAWVLLPNRQYSQGDRFCEGICQTTLVADSRILKRLFGYVPG